MQKTKSKNTNKVKTSEADKNNSETKSDEKQHLELKILRSPFIDKAELKQYLDETAKTIKHRPDAQIITWRPFKEGAGYVLDREYAKQKELSIGVELSKTEKELISNFTGESFSYTQRFTDLLEAEYRKKCCSLNEDVKEHGWDRIIERISNYISNVPKPLSGNAQIVFEILNALPPQEAMLVPVILKEVSFKYNKFWDEKELYKRIFPQLKSWGLKNIPRIGYYLEKSSHTPS